MHRHVELIKHCYLVYGLFTKNESLHHSRQMGSTVNSDEN